MQNTQDVVILAEPGSTRHHAVWVRLRQESHSVVVIASLPELLKYLSDTTPLAVVVALDYRTADGGWIVAERAWERQPDLRLVLTVNGDADDELPPAGEKYRLLTWPFSADALRSALGSAHDRATTLEKCA